MGAEQAAERLREAEAEMWAWAKGERSHINEFLSVEGDANRAQTLAAVAQADAAEVSRWSNAVIGLRGDAGLRAERDALAATVDRVRALCDEHRSMYPEDAPSVLVRDLDAALAGHTDGDHTTHTDTADRGGDDAD